MLRTTFALLAVSLSIAYASAQEAPPGAPVTQPATQPGAQPPQQAIITIDQMLNTAESLLRVGNNTQAKSILDLVLERDPNNVRAKLVAAELAIAQQEYFAARNYYREVLNVEQTNLDANVGLARIYLMTRMFRQAASYLETAQRVAPPDRLPEVLTMLAASYRGRGSLLDALNAAQRAVDLAPQNVEARQTLIAVLMEADRFDPAMTHAAALTELATAKVRENPASREGLMQLLGAYGMQEQVLRAFHNTLYEYSPSGEPTDRPLPGKQAQAAGVIKQIVDLRVLQAEVARTVTYFDILELARKAAQYQPENPQYHLLCGQLYVKMSQIDAAIGEFQRVLELAPGDADATRYLRELNAPLTSQPAAAAGTP